MFLQVFMCVFPCHARNPVVKISPTVTVVGDGVLSPRVASFSSRGPSAAFPGILKVYINIFVQDTIFKNIITTNILLATLLSSL